MFRNLQASIDEVVRLIGRYFRGSSKWVICAVLIIAMPTGAWARLAASSAGLNSVTLSWIAPGDDGSTGTASIYDIRYSSTLITEGNWGASSQVTGEPTPQVAGSVESFTVTPLDPGSTYYFAIKTRDEVFNWSALSNVISVSTDDQTAPATIDDLEIVE